MDHKFEDHNSVRLYAKIKISRNKRACNLTYHSLNSITSMKEGMKAKEKSSQEGKKAEKKGRKHGM